MRPGEGKGERAISSRAVGLAAAVCFFAVGVVVAYDSRRVGATWADDGPQAGYFPFYIALTLCAAAVVNFVTALRGDTSVGTSFVTIPALRSVVSVAVPAALYVLMVHVLGLYVTSFVFIAGFMVALGKYRARRAVSVGAGVSLTLYVLFERWFIMPLPKGPLEALLGLE